MSELLTRASFGQFAGRPADISLAQFGVPRAPLPEDTTGGIGLPGIENALVPSVIPSVSGVPQPRPPFSFPRRGPTPGRFGFLSPFEDFNGFDADRMAGGFAAFPTPGAQTNIPFEGFGPFPRKGGAPFPGARPTPLPKMGVGMLSPAELSALTGGSRRF